VKELNDLVPDLKEKDVQSIENLIRTDSSDLMSTLVNDVSKIPRKRLEKVVKCIKKGNCIQKYSTVVGRL
ncbi:hypothetical protein MKX03_013576, partial [Papaver bracteatum]